MIVKEFYATREDGVNLHRTYSDANLKIQKVGTDEVYDEAIDTEGAPYTYVETDVPIDTDTVDGWYEVDAPEEDRNNSDDQMM